MIYDDYIEYTETYRKKYGELSVVFMQVGDFFELYAIDNDTEKAGADIYTVCDLCNIQVSRKNKSILENSRQNPLMAGFPIAIVSKHIQTLVQHQYTVIIIRQVTPPPNPKREVTEIISPSTLSQPQGSENTYLMALFWEYNPIQFSSSSGQWSVGMCCVDVTTGDVHVSDAFPKLSDPHFAKDEAYRWMQAIQPREILLISDCDTDELVQGLMQDLQIPHVKIYRSVHEYWGHDKIPIYQKIAFQEQTFEKIYAKQHGMISFIDAFDLEKSEHIRMSMMFAFQFIFEHNEKMMECLKPPQRYEPAKYLNVHYNALLQLNTISNTPGEKPLLSILNRCATAFGGRLFKEHLLNPILCIDTLEQRYNKIEWWMNCPELHTVRKRLSSIFDLERYARRILLEQLAPCEWVSIASSMDSCRKLVEIVKKYILEHNADNIDKDIEVLENILQQLEPFIKEKLIIEEASKFWLHDIRGNVFYPTIYTELDKVQEDMDFKMTQLYQLATILSSYVANGSEQSICKVESNDREGYYLSITKKRWEGILARLQKDNIETITIHAIYPSDSTDAEHVIYIKDFKAKPISSSSTVLRLTHVFVERLSHDILLDQRKVSTMATEAYMDFMRENKSCIAMNLTNMVSILSDMDVSITHAKNALEFCYQRPKLDKKSTKSYIQASKLRHPIIERIQTQYTYIPNDISLGQDKDGWLLYGINASGKSSLMKAIGLNIIMAQAGSFVPCESLMLRPYQYIFTRISGADNIYRGMSSFTVEMTELRNILNRCNENSLVLGDELCAGTEALSALSIVASGIESLAQKKASFVFATHLHELLQLECIPENVDVYHIHIEIDENTGSIIYDRHLSKGSGHPYYGLEVCKALQLPDDFLRRAHMYRRKIQDQPNTIVNEKKSNYNKTLFMDTCQVCGKKSTETHHIMYQKNAEVNKKYKHVGHIGLHSKSNLVSLCEQCHLREHQGELKIEGYLQTSEGKKLRVRKTLKNNE